MNDNLASYWNTPVPLGALASLCWREGGVTGKQSACWSITWGRGNTLNLEDTRRKRGNRRTRIIPLVDTYGIIFPKTAQDCKPFFMKVSELGCGYAAGVDLWITLQGQVTHKLHTRLDNTACCPHNTQPLLL
jgi:hypothetical protein